MSRPRLVVLNILALAALVAGPALSTGRPALATGHTFPVYTGEEFTDLFDGLDLPDTERLAAPPEITGDAAADARIREIAEDRGYQLRPRIVDDLETVGNETVHRHVAEAWQSLEDAAAADGHNLVLVSGFRSIDDQRDIFLDELDGEAVARIGRPYTEEEIAEGDADGAIDDVLEFHSIPGYSKHHTGHAIDITTAGDDLSDFADTAAFAWTSADNYRNAKLHGFVPSYPPGAREQGPQPERWEYVWVGRRTIVCRGANGFQAHDPPSTSSAATAIAQDTSRFVPVPPTRVFDTRTDAAPSDYLCAGDTLEVQVTGVGGVPTTDVSAVVLNVTVTRTEGEGYLTVWPTGTSQPYVSSLNAVRPGQTVPNLVTVPVGADGKVSFMTSMGAHVLADVLGYYEVAETAASGRLSTVAPTRVADTRAEETPSAAFRSGETRRLDVLTPAGVSPGDVSAVVVNVTLTQTVGHGHAAVWPGDQEWGGTSNLNFDGSGQDVANLVITPVDGHGAINVRLSGGDAHVVVDLFGYFTGAGEESGSGMFVAIRPERAFDTRTPEQPAGRVSAGETVIGSLAATTAVPPDAAAVVVNQTTTDTAGMGYLTAWPAGTDRPEVSNLNVSRVGETRANAAILPIDDTGSIAVFSSTSAHVLADVFGYYTP